MSIKRKHKLDIGTFDDVFRGIKSEELITKFKSGEDDDIFNETINLLDSSVHLSDKTIETFKNGDDDNEFENLIQQKVKKCNVVHEVRQKCKIQAKKFNYSEELLNRFPMWVFRYFAALDPMCREDNETKKIEIMTIFMLINKISPDLMMAFYIEGGQSVHDAMKIRDFFNKMKEIHDEHEKDDLIALFGSNFTFHCQTKTLRRIDMSIVESSPRGGPNEPFIPDTMEWRRQRVIRNLIANGQFTVFDDMDLMEVKQA